MELYEITYKIFGFDRLLYNQPVKWGNCIFEIFESGGNYIASIKFWEHIITNQKHLKTARQRIEKKLKSLILAYEWQYGINLNWMKIEEIIPEKLKPLDETVLEDTASFIEEVNDKVKPKNPPDIMPQVPLQCERWIKTWTETGKLSRFVEEQHRRHYLIIEEFKTEFENQYKMKLKDSYEKLIRDFVSHPICCNEKVIDLVKPSLPSAVVYINGKERVRFLRTVEHRNFIAKYETKARELVRSLVNEKIKNITKGSKMIVDILSELQFLIYSEEIELTLNTEKTLDEWQLKQSEIQRRNGPITGIEITRSFSFSVEIETNKTIDFKKIRKSVDEHMDLFQKEAMETFIIPFVDALTIKLKYPAHIEKKRKWLNEKEIKEKLEKHGINLKNKGIMVVQSLRNSLTGSEEITSMYDYFQNYLTNLNTEHKKEVSRIVGWLDKGLRQEDCYDEFMCYWIAFNALYEGLYRGGANKDASKFEWLLRHLYLNGDIATQNLIDSLRRNYKSAVNFLSTQDFKSTTGKTSYSKELKGLEERADISLNYLITITHCIYCVRKKLFHGELSNAQKDRNVQASLPILKAIVFDTVDQVLIQRILK